MKKYIIYSIAAIVLLAFGWFGYAMAAEKIGTETAPNGESYNKVKIEAEVISISTEKPRVMTFKDGADGKEYKAIIGPEKVSGTYNLGDKAIIEGVAKEGRNETTFKIMKINDTELRQQLGRPAWARKGSNANTCNSNCGRRKQQ